MKSKPIYLLYDDVKKLIIYKWRYLGVKKLDPSANLVLLSILSEMRIKQSKDYIDITQPVVIVMTQTSHTTRIHPTVFKKSLKGLEERGLIERITEDNRYLIRLTSYTINILKKYTNTASYH